MESSAATTCQGKHGEKESPESHKILKTIKLPFDRLLDIEMCYCVYSSVFIAVALIGSHRRIENEAIFRASGIHLPYFIAADHLNSLFFSSALNRRNFPFIFIVFAFFFSLAALNLFAPASAMIWITVDATISRGNV